MISPVHVRAAALAIALILFGGCRQTRCIEPSAECLQIAVDTRDAGGGITAVRIVSFESSCAQDLRLFCQIGAWDAGLSTGSFRNFYFDTRTVGPVADPFGAEEIFVEDGMTLGLACVSLAPSDSDDVMSCVNADCGVPAAEDKAIDAAMETNDCRTGGFFVPITIAP